MKSRRNVRNVFTAGCLLLALSLAAGNAFRGPLREAYPKQFSISVTSDPQGQDALSTSRNQQSSAHLAKKSQPRQPAWSSALVNGRPGFASPSTRWLLKRENSIPLYYSRSTSIIRGRAPPVSS